MLKIANIRPLVGQEGSYIPTDEELDIAKGGDDDRRKPAIETISRFGDKEEPEIGKGLKIMTPRQMITRLPILLAKKQASNNSQKLNNEIRQTFILYTGQRIYQNSL